jgi:uncharacterized protein (DUF983 family)
MALNEGMDEPKRPLWRALRRGFTRRCPACGTGGLFVGYTRVASACASCGEDLSHHRADDAPPYFTMLLVGHVVVPLVLLVETNFALSTWEQLAIWLPATLFLSLALLPRIKGATIALQWANRMHGFGGRTE